MGGRRFSCGSAACPRAAFGSPGARPGPPRASGRGRRRLLPVARTRPRRSSSRGDRERRGRGRSSHGSSSCLQTASSSPMWGRSTASATRRQSFAALARLIQGGMIDGERVAVRLVGSLWLEGFEPPPGVRVERAGYVGHGRAVEEMCKATALLLYVPGSSLAPSGKLFEYLASGRPILCLTRPDNLASQLVREWNAGVVAEPNDEAAIDQALLTLWQRWEENGLPDQAEVRRKTLAALLAPQECGAAGSSSR